MANLSSIARPYALAAFEYAHESQQLLEWQAFLSAAGTIAKQPNIMKLLSNPMTDQNELYELFQGVLSSLLDDKRKNFLQLVAQNKRLLALAEISELYNSMYLALEKISKIRVVTAVEIQDDYKEKLGVALSKRVKHNVTLRCEIDPAILGGAVIHIGDRVIDGSVRGKLTRLYQSLSS
jgi:F-type H+-transporting ATPase subunit delta